MGNNSIFRFDKLGLLTQAIGVVNENYEFDMDTRKGVEGTTKFSVSMEKTAEGCQMIVTVGINLVGGVIFPIGGEKQGYGYEDQDEYKPLTDAEAKLKLPELQKGINNAWNGKFKVCCDELQFGNDSERKIFHTGPKRSPREFERNNYYQSDCCCEVVFKLVADPSGIKVGLFEMKPTGSNEFEWNLTNPGLTAGQTAAHEFGHMIGNIDEYNGGRNGTIAGRDKPYGQKPAGKDYPDSIMGPKGGTGKPDMRHMWRVMQVLEVSNTANGCKLSTK